MVFESLKDMYRRRDLIGILATSNLKASEKNTFLGYIWWLLDPVLMVRLAGTVNTPRLLDRVTVAVLVAALVMVTVQVELCPLPKVLGVQLKLDNCAGATRFKV